MVLCGDDDNDPFKDLDQGILDTAVPGAEMYISAQHNQWVIVSYDKSRYPGEVAQVEDSSNIEVNVMYPSGNF